MIYLVGLKNTTKTKSIFVNEIKFFDFNIDLAPYDFIIFTSKNAINSCLINNINLKNKQILSIGKATSEFLKSHNLEAFYTGKTSHASEFKHEILPFLTNKKVLYFKAKKITSDLDAFLKQNNINLTCIDVYENIRLDIPLDNNFKEFKEKINKNDILIFLAPSGVNDFYYHFKSFPTTNIAIGKSTQATLKLYGINALCPKIASVDECIKLANNLM